MCLRTAVVGVLAACVLPQVAGAVTLGQRDNFQTPGVAGWTVGNLADHPDPPVWIFDGGPLGPGDHFLQVEGAGGDTAGSKPNTFNASQWAGDYLAAGVTAIELDVKYLGQGPETMQLRVGLEGPGGFVWSLNTEPVSPGTPFPWHQAVFPIDPANLGGGNPAAVLGDVTKLWLYHAPVGDTPRNSPALDVRIGYDNIHAVPEPGTAAMLLGGCLGLLLLWRRGKRAA